MKKITVLFMLLAGLILFPGCKSKREALIEDAMSNYEAMTTVLKTVKDKESAQAAKPKLEALSNRLEKLSKEANALGKPSKEENEALQKKYEDRMNEVMKDFVTETMRVGMNPELNAELSDVFSQKSIGW